MTARGLALATVLIANVASAAEWRVQVIDTPGPVAAIEVADSEPRIAIGATWHRIAGDSFAVTPAAPLERAALPAGALPDGRVVAGEDTIARAWLAAPTGRYGHGVLGDAIEAESLVVERRDGKRMELRLDPRAVFEDLVPRIARLDGRENLVVVKSYLDRGAALAIVDPASAAIVAETPPIGRPNAWLNPAGIADFDGDGTIDIALVRQPHVLGRLELWSWRGGRLEKLAEMADVSNHVIGSRALEMSAVADFDGDGRPDLALPSLDRRALRLVGFVPQPREIARVALPGRIATNIGVIRRGERAAIVAGLDDGTLVLVRGGE